MSSKLDGFEADVRGLVSVGVSNAVIADRFGVNEASVRRFLKKHQIERPERRAVDDPVDLRNVQLAAEVKMLRRTVAEQNEKLADQAEFWERVVDLADLKVKVPTFQTRERTGDKPGRSVILPVYDQQYGQFVRAEDTPGNRGLFNREVFDQRLQRWVDGAKGIMRMQSAAYQLDELIFVMGGDQVEGDEIFPGQPWQLEMDPMRQMFELEAKMSPAITDIIRFAREELGIGYVAVYCVPGNHGKVGGKKSGARPAVYSWDWGFDRLLQERVGPLVDEFAIEPGGALFFRCAGHEFQAIHGDQIKGWGGLPFYGLTKFDGRSIRLHNIIYRYLLMGHHHQPAGIPNGAGETIVSGDWVGANNLSGMITAASRPRQEVLFVSDRLGLAETARIWFTDADEAYAPTKVYGRAA